MLLVHTSTNADKFEFPNLANKLQKANYVSYNLNKVDSIEAEGKEAKFIYELFGGNTNTTKRPTIPFNLQGYITDKQVWYGDIARTILATLTIY